MSAETLRLQIQELEAEIAELEESIKVKAAKKATTLARMQAKLFLEMVFAPYMDGLCGGWGVSPEEGLKLLITENTSLDSIAKNNPADLATLVNTPEIQKIVEIASPLKDVSDDWIKDKMTVLFDVMVELRPNLARVIVETPGGTDWFYESLTGLRKLLFGKPQINRLPSNSETAPQSHHV